MVRSTRTLSSTLTLLVILVLAAAATVAAQEDDAGASARATTIPESATPTPTWLDEQTCTDPDFLTPASAGGGSDGDMFDCAKALGLRKGDPGYDAYDFRVWKRTDSQERWTQQCDEAGTHIGSRYHAFGTDRLYNEERPEQVVEGSFDFTVSSTLLDPDRDTWQVEKQGVLWDVRAADGDWSWTWSVDATAVAEGMPENPFLTQYRGVEPAELQAALCDYLK